MNTFSSHFSTYKTFVLATILLISNSLFGQDQNYTWVRPIDSKNVAGINQTMEIGINVSTTIQTEIKQFLDKKKSGINPYAGEDINIQAIFTSPSGKTYKRFGFYYQNFRVDERINEFVRYQTNDPFRIRFAPNEIGNWKVEIDIITKLKVKEQPITLDFKCEASEHKGPLVAEENERYLKYKQSGDGFFGIGHNVSSGGFFTFNPRQCDYQMQGIRNLSYGGGNFTRLELSAQSALPNWYDLNSYEDKQDEMYGFDQVMTQCEDLKMYAIIFRHHVEIMGDDWDVPNWKNNPVRKKFQLQSVKEYYTNEEARKLEKQNLRYIYSRWGYSPYWSFYGYSEVEKWYEDMVKEGMSENEAIQTFKEWAADQQNYVHESLNAEAAFCHSYGILPGLEEKKGYDGVLKLSDIVALHRYGSKKDVNDKRRAVYVNDFYEMYQKPVLLEEIGLTDNVLPIYCCTGVEFKNSVWSSTFMGDLGVGMDWWWDRGLQENNYHLELLGIKQFLNGIDFSKDRFTPYYWDDANRNRRTLENYCMIDSSKTSAIGWVNNATNHWRNIAVTDSCLSSLVNNNQLSIDCVVGEDGIVNLKDSKNEEYSRDRYLDAYTDKGGVQEIGSAELAQNPNFKVHGLLKGMGKNRAWYKIEFYDISSPYSVAKVEEFTQIVSSNIFRSVRISTPKLDINIPNYAYKMTFIQRSKKKP
ncbi:MAG: hypothetical protein ACI9XP_000638 [Lentimonas sp.]|jgi:hypothetical protein